MLIFLWFICVLLLLIVVGLLAWLLLLNPKTKETLQILRGGFHRGLRYCGLNISNRKYPLELWKWETLQDEDVCDDCLERATWPAMDIADWMKVGMPGTPEVETECGDNCRCQLVRYESTILFKKHHRKK